MSVTNPSPPRATPPGAGDAGAGPGPAGRLDALLTPLAGRLVLGAGALVAVVVFAVRQTTPNYDSYYALVWGQEILHGHLPDYAVLRQPTPHPLSTRDGGAARALRDLGRPPPRAAVAADLRRLPGRRLPVRPAPAGVARGAPGGGRDAHAHRHGAPGAARRLRPPVLRPRARRRGARARPAAPGVAGPRASRPGGSAAPGGVAALGGLLGVARARDATGAARPLRAPGGRRAGPVAGGRPRRHGGAVLLADLDARGLRRVRAQPRLRRGGEGDPELRGRPRPGRDGRRRRARPAARRVSSCAGGRRCRSRSARSASGRSSSSPRPACR